MSFVDDILATISFDTLVQRMKDNAAAAGAKFLEALDIIGSPEEQLFSLTAQGVYIARETISQAINGMYLDRSLDLGDGDGQEDGKGWLSARGEGEFYTPRIEKLFGTGFIELDATLAPTQYNIKP